MLNANWYKENGLIMACLAGSHLYGLNRDDSDIDIRGICFSTIESLLGLTGFEQYQLGKAESRFYSQEEFGIESEDVTIYSLPKFFKLCLDANPNIIELLFVPQNAILFSAPSWEQIIANRELFLSTKVIHTFAGYAYQQLSKIKNHKRWLGNAPDKPNPVEYGLSPKLGGGWKWIDKDKYDAYCGRTKEWEAYESWRNNRNPERAKLEERYGFDSKHALHLYRLFFEGEELLRTGRITLPLELEIQKKLLSIFHGEISYDEILSFGEQMKDKLYALEETSPIPKRPNRKEAEILLIKLQRGKLIE